jgi:hypothetical protein
MAGVEFLSSESDDDEVEPPEREPAAPRARWQIWAVRIVLVVVAVAGLSVWIATRPSGPVPVTHQAATEPLPTPSRQAPSDPTMITCAVGTSVPDEVAQAMHRFLKGITINNLQADRCVSGTIKRARTVSEAVIGSFGRFHIEVALSRRDADFESAFQAAPPAGRTSTLLGTVETESAGVKVRVSVTGRSGTHAPMYRVQRLADFISLNTVL